MTNRPHHANRRRPDGAAFAIAAGLASIGAVMIRQGVSIPDKGGYSGVGSGDMPVLIGGVLVALAVWTLVAGFYAPSEERPAQAVGPLVWIVGGLALQLILLKPAGFAIASGILFACTAAAFGKRTMWISLPVGTLFALVVYGIFDRLLQLNLPQGVLESLIYGG